MFGALMLLVIGSPLVRSITGYDYPAPPELAFELNALGDRYDLIFVVPSGLVGLWLLWRGSRWGPVLMAGVAANVTYNYAMVVTGVQNLWIFAWVAKLALAGTSLVMLWPLLPGGAGVGAPRRRGAVVAYLVLVGVVLSMQMGQRLLASAMGRVMQMTGVTTGEVDWSNPMVRDAVVYFSLAFPMMVAAIAGLVRRAEWGWKAAVVLNVFIPYIVSLILFTGPLQEQLVKGSISGPMWAMSAMLTLVAAGAVAALIWLVRAAPGQT